MAEQMGSLRKTTGCGVLRAEDVLKNVVVCGWVQRRRSLGSLIFIDLRDRTGIVQVVFDQTVTDKNLFDKAESVRSEFVLAVQGTVRERSAKTDKIETGEIEILASNLKILSEAEVTPFEILDDVNVNENLRLRYRYLDLRRPKLQKNLLIRSKITNAARQFLSDNGFIEIETPYLGKSTPEGARDYLVPSRIHEGCFYALPQSPQLYKQLLMISGFDRYFQVAKCFRDEDLRSNRQPEFTQIDLEMSFVEDETDVMHAVEGLVKKIFKEAAGVGLGDGHFKTMTYDQAMERFGSDKPDTRFSLELTNISDLVSDSPFIIFSNALSAGGSVRAINLKGKAGELSRKDLDTLCEFAKTLGATALLWMMKPKGEPIKSSFSKFLDNRLIETLFQRLEIAEDDVIFISAGKNITVFNTLGGLRLHLGEKFKLFDKNEYDILWIVEFPMFEYSEEENRYVAVHHPFTSPKNEDIHLIETDPTKMRAKAYDLVINGQEAGGGSIRIHSNEIQQKIFSVLKFSDEDIKQKFGFFVDAFKFGTPPHGGLALGLDRLTMILAKTDSIKDVIAFPKVQNASCLLSDAPSFVEQKQLDELFITVNDNSK